AISQTWDAPNSSREKIRECAGTGLGILIGRRWRRMLRCSDKNSAALLSELEQPRHERSVAGGAIATGLPDLFLNLGQVVGFRALQRRELLVGFQLLQPEHLPDGQHVPIIDIRGYGTGERAAQTEQCALGFARRLLERI